MKILGFIPCEEIALNEDGTYSLENPCLQSLALDVFPGTFEIPVFLILGRDELDIPGRYPIALKAVVEGRTLMTMEDAVLVSDKQDVYRCVIHLKFELQSPAIVRLFLSVEAFGLSASWHIQFRRGLRR